MSTPNQPPSYPGPEDQPTYPPAPGGQPPPPSYPATPDGPGGQPPPSYPVTGGSGGQPSYGGPSGYQGQPPKSGNTLSIVAIVCGVVAVLILPIVFGPIGIICGGIAVSRKERLGKVGLGVAIAGMVVGFAIGVLVLNSTR